MVRDHILLKHVSRGQAENVITSLYTSIISLQRQHKTLNTLRTHALRIPCLLPNYNVDQSRQHWICREKSCDDISQLQRKNRSQDWFLTNIWSWCSQARVMRQKSEIVRMVSVLTWLCVYSFPTPFILLKHPSFFQWTVIEKHFNQKLIRKYGATTWLFVAEWLTH